MGEQAGSRDRPGRQDALDITVRLGSGRGRTTLSAFDSALQGAGVADFNLVTLSSVIPPRSRVRMVDTVLDGGHGDVLFCVRSEAFAERPGEVVWAGLGWCVDADGAGLFVEHHGTSEDTVLEQIELSLGDMKAKRPGAYGRPQFAVASARCVDEPVCALVLAAYRVSSWFELSGPQDAARAEVRPAKSAAAEVGRTAPSSDGPPGAETAPASGSVATLPRREDPATTTNTPTPTTQAARTSSPSPVAKVTLEQKIDVSTARRYYQLYRKTFGPLATKAVARQLLHEGEFLEEMVDPRVEKYVAWDQEGQVVGISTVTTDLATVPWISPDYFAHHYPDQHARGAIFYLGWTLVSAERQGDRVFTTMASRMAERLGDQTAVVAWDMCMLNEQAGFAASVNALLSSLVDVTIETVDRQTYWSGVVHGPR